LVKVTGQFEVFAYKATIGCNWFLGLGWPGQPITFDGDVVDSAGNLVVGVEVSINEKDLFGRLVPVKKSNGEPVIGFTDAKGHYSLTDDDGWPDGGSKVVWAHAYNGYDIVSDALSLYVLGIPYIGWQPTRWPIPLFAGAALGVIVVGAGAYQLYRDWELR